MCHSHTNNMKINKLHERCLRIIHNNKQWSFSELLETDGSVCSHMRNIQSLAIEMFRVSRNTPKIWDMITKVSKQFKYLRVRLKNGSLKIVLVEFVKFNLIYRFCFWHFNDHNAGGKFDNQSNSPIFTSTP